MNRKINIKSALTLAVVAIAALALNASAAFVDTFDVPVGTGADVNLNLNQAARQAGSTYGLTYNVLNAALAGAVAQTYLTQTEAYDGTGVVMMRSLSDGGTYGGGTATIASSSALVNEDLLSELGGTHYTISYTGLMIDRLGNLAGAAPTGLDSWFQSISLGGATGRPNEPNVGGATGRTDFGVMISSTGIASIWDDGAMVSSVAIAGFSLGTAYDVLMDVDEANDLYSASVTVGGVETVLPAFTVTIDNNGGVDGRRLQFHNRLFTTAALPDIAGWDAWGDAEINNLQIVPEPATLGLIGMASLGLLAFRRLKYRFSSN